MYSYSREMIAYKLIYIFVALLILQTCLLTEAVSSVRNRRRPSLGPAKQATDEVTDKTQAIPDQIALAAGGNGANQYRRDYGRNGEDFSYGNLEMNLIRPENEQQSLRIVPHTQITTQYTSSISTSAQREMDAQRELDNAETAEEYVSKAMQMYGTRLREPIRIPSETETQQANVANQQQQQTSVSSSSSSDSSNNNNNPNYDFYELANKQYQSQPLPQQQQTDQKQYIAPQVQAELQAQLQQAQQQMDEQQQQQQQQQEPERSQQQELQQQQLEAQTEHGQLSPASQQPAPNFEKDPVTRSYEVYDDAAATYDGTSQDVDRHYRPKYHYQTAYRDINSEEQEQERIRLEEEKIRVSASTEIPKAEIMKQIEKSVMKYMKELEAEGKIITAPKEQKTYYKVVTVPEKTEEKRISSTTYKPKYITSSPSPNYHGNYAGSSSSLSSSSLLTGQQQSSSQSLNSGISGYSGTRHHKPKYAPKQQHYQSETESAYQAPSLPHQELTDALAPNVEFIYKIKTRAPLQTATVKTVSKPYTLPLKGTYDHFDHSAALKNLEDFDLSHVVTTQDPDERPSAGIHGSAVGKPSKLYFNSEIYHDINSLPYKPEKTRNVPAEYRKVKAAEVSPDYKGYSGYFAEPSSESEEKDQSTSSISGDDGYPVMNPYQYVLKKEPVPSKYDDSSSANWEQPRSKPSLYSMLTAQKALEYDSYSPKFNNNPEGYGYQHSYKHASSERETSHGNHKYSGRHISSGGKRGKRGGGQHPSAAKKNVRGGASTKDIEANLALRPPPKV